MKKKLRKIPIQHLIYKSTNKISCFQLLLRHLLKLLLHVVLLLWYNQSNNNYYVVHFFLSLICCFPFLPFPYLPLAWFHVNQFFLIFQILIGFIFYTDFIFFFSSLHLCLPCFFQQPLLHYLLKNPLPYLNILYLPLYMYSVMVSWYLSFNLWNLPHGRQCTFYLYQFLYLLLYFSYLQLNPKFSLLSA